MVTYKNMSVLDAPLDSFILHSCNLEGKWDSGVAKQIKDEYPRAFDNYKERVGYQELGDYNLFISDLYVVNLFVSKNDSKHPDSPDSILFWTGVALDKFVREMTQENQSVYLPKINSGGFKVPWNKTENILNILSEKYKINWVVCDPQ